MVDGRYSARVLSLARRRSNRGETLLSIHDIEALSLTEPAMRYAVLVTGPAGAGKSTFCASLMTHLHASRRTGHLVNLDPAAAPDSFEYAPTIDIKDLVSVEDVMSELGYGPNGGLVYCFEYVSTSSSASQAITPSLYGHTDTFCRTWTGLRRKSANTKMTTLSLIVRVCLVPSSFRVHRCGTPRCSKPGPFAALTDTPHVFLQAR